MISSTTHPTEQVLAAYGLGKLADPEAEVVDRHLETCAECRKRVSAIAK